MLSETYLGSLQKLRNFSETKENYISLYRVQMMQKGMTSSIGDDVRYRLNGAKRVVYSVEEHPMGICRHASMSNRDSDVFTIDDDAELILKTLGFQPGIKILTYRESIEGMKKQVLNFIQPYSECVNETEGPLVFHFNGHIVRSKNSQGS